MAVDRLDLVVQPGEFVTLLGPSGSGKTTTMMMVAGFEEHTGGSVLIDGQPVDRLPPRERGLGVVFQNYALFPHMMVRGNVGFGLKMRGTPKAESVARVAKAFNLVQLAGHEDKLPGQLSGGQQQRVAIARAIVIEPPLLLMDEPLSNLDAKLRLEMRSEIRRIHRQLGRATIYVTHDQDEALSLADRIVVMKDGVMQQVATPQEVYAQPANLDVARFMGYRNVIALDVEKQDGDRVVVSGQGIRLTGIAKQPITGKRAYAAMRPEEISLGSEGPNVVEGRVDNLEYSGRDSLIDVVTSGGVLLHARSAGAAALGDTVRITVLPERVLLYPHEAVA